MALRALTNGKMPVKCVPGRLAMARLRPDAFPSGNPWHFFHSMYPKRGLGREKGASWQDSRSMHPKRAGFGKICAPCIRKAPQIAVGGYTARRSCQEGALFAARAPRIMHSAQILPSAAEQCERSQPRRRPYGAAACLGTAEQGAGGFLSGGVTPPKGCVVLWGVERWRQAGISEAPLASL